MNTSQAIETRGLSKRYIIGDALPIYRSVRDMITDLAYAPIKRYRKLSGQAQEDSSIWALRDLDLQVQSGEVIGVIGRNGSGKSTLLKILSRITEPTTGRAVIHGRVSSLLEVGTGFHPELTGRENTFLNAAILGMTRAETTRKFDEIVAFAELEKFIDTPVKRYSSGMAVRLAFSIAAHLDPEVLLVDEVLAVGDVAFQNKCLGHLSKAGSSGRTVLFVSHQLHSVQQLCSRAIILEDGRMVFDGDVGMAVARYLSGVQDQSSAEWRASDMSVGGGYGKVLSVRVLNDDSNLQSEFGRGENVHIEIEIVVNKSEPELVLSCDFLRQGLVAFRTNDFDAAPDSGRAAYQKGVYKVAFCVPGEMLNFGEYHVHPKLGLFRAPERPGAQVGSVVFRVRKDTSANEYVSRLWEDAYPGAVYPKLAWNVGKME